MLEELCSLLLTFGDNPATFFKRTCKDSQSIDVRAPLARLPMDGAASNLKVNEPPMQRLRESAKNFKRILEELVDMTSMGL